MKYILYKTTNLINNYIYIGVHKTETPYEFDKYLGNGVYINKPNTYEKSKTCFQKAVKEFGIKNFRRETLAVYDTLEEAYNAEKIIVNDEFLARTDVYNMIKGGIINNIIGNSIYKYSAKTGEFIEEFSSQEEAAKNIHVSSSILYNSIKYRFQIKGYVFDLNKVDKINLDLYNFKNVVTYFNELYKGWKYKVCTECGIRFKLKSINSNAKYCVKCAKKVKTEKTITARKNK